MLLDATINRNVHLFIILEKSHINAVKQWAKQPYGVISAPFHAQLSNLRFFDTLCADETLKLFDCGDSKAPILDDSPHHIDAFIYQGTPSTQLQQYAEIKDYHLLSKRPPAMLFSIDDTQWHAQIEQWQRPENAIKLADYL